jgi:CheY-like chemotaxis protein
LYSLLEYLEGRAKVRVLIVGECPKELDVMKHIIRSFDKEYSVEISDKPRSTYYRADLAKLDIIFADLSMKNPSIYEFIDMIKKRFKQTNSHAVLCITSNTFTKESLIKLKEKDINNLLATNLTEDELQSKLKDIIDFIDE